MLHNRVVTAVADSRSIHHKTLIRWPEHIYSYLKISPTATLTVHVVPIRISSEHTQLRTRVPLSGRVRLVSHPSQDGVWDGLSKQTSGLTVRIPVPRLS